MIPSDKTPTKLIEIVQLFDVIISDLFSNEAPIIEKVHVFLEEYRTVIAQLPITSLIKLRNEFNHSFESVLFFIIMIEFVKLNSIKNIELFVIFLCDIFIPKRGQQVSLEDFNAFIDENVAIALENEKLYQNEYKNYIYSYLMVTANLITDVVQVIFETNIELAEFTKIITLADISNPKHYRSDLSKQKKEKVKEDTMKMTQRSYQKIIRIFQYLEIHYVTENGLFKIRNDKNLAIFYKMVQFYIKHDELNALKVLESVKGNIFLTQLRLSNFKFNGDVSTNQVLQQLLRQEETLQTTLRDYFMKNEIKFFEELSELSKVNSSLQDIYQKILIETDNTDIQQYVHMRQQTSLEYEAIKSLL
ncbi:MAG: hypothetical protein ACRBFS_13975 [Aureispira sp.]